MKAMVEPLAATDEIDWSRPFMPPQLTHLFHTAVWGQLTGEQALRYVQLQALCTHEQIIFFERSFAPTVLNALLTRPLPGLLREGLRTFLAEEERHTQMFWRLNQRCARQWYGRSMFHFIRTSPAAGAAMGVMTRRPRWFPLCLWMMLLQEDRALYYGRAFLRDATVEDHFRAVHRLHLADEAGHVRWDQELLELVWPETPGWLKWLNIRLCSWLIAEFFSAPKRSGLRVIEEWIEQRTELRPRKKELVAALAGLEHNRAFRRTLYGPDVVPAAWSQLRRWPECRRLVRTLEAAEATCDA